MKKIITTFLLLLGANCFASKLIYCPERIECSGNTMESCRAIGGNQEIFNIMNGMKIEKAIYNFSYASGLYIPTEEELKNHYVFNNCLYKHSKHPRITKIIQLSVDKRSNIELYFEDSESNKWVMPGGLISECKSSNPQDCPFKVEV